MMDGEDTGCGMMLRGIVEVGEENGFVCLFGAEFCDFFLGFLFFWGPGRERKTKTERMREREIIGYLWVFGVSECLCFWVFWVFLVFFIVRAANAANAARAANAVIAGFFILCYCVGSSG